MKINWIRISNIFSFKYEENIDNVQVIEFDDDLNIIIGPNGAGKSNFLEIINQIFKKTFFRNCIVSPEKAIDAKENPTQQKRNEINNLTSPTPHTLQKNNLTKDKPLEIKLRLKLSKQDITNLIFIRKNQETINRLMFEYYNINLGISTVTENEIDKLETMDFHFIDFNDMHLRYKETVSPPLQSFVYSYLHWFEFIQNTIIISNRIMSTNWSPLKNTFALIGASREYQKFEPTITIDGKGGYWQELKSKMVMDSTKNVSNEEPIALPFLKYKLAVIFTHLREDLADSKRTNTGTSATQLLKMESIYKNINKYLNDSLGLELEVTKPEPLSLEYTFRFKDKNGTLHTIPELSSGERGIVHFIFSIFGYDLKNGLMIIDEPELHIHPQMQEKYLQIMLTAQKDQSMQFIVATHSSIFVNPDTVSGVHRFFKDDSGFTQIVTANNIKTEDIDLVRILRYTDSSKIFFSNKVILVEGDTDEFFYRSFFDKFREKNNLDIEAEFLQIRGRTNYEEWKIFLGKYNIPTYFIGDLDNILREDLPFIDPSIKSGLVDEFLKEQKTIEKIQNDTDYRTSKPFRNDLLEFIKTKKTSEWSNIKNNISSKYHDGLFILQAGVLEDYMGIGKGLKNTVSFCKNDLETWYSSGNANAQELKTIFSSIFKISSAII